MCNTDSPAPLHISFVFFFNDVTHFSFLFECFQVMSVSTDKLQHTLIKIDLPGGEVVNKSTTGSDAGVT